MSVPWEITAEQARRIVHEAAERNGWISHEDYENSTPASRRAITHLRSQLGNLTEMIARDIYLRKARFVLELIQNAEDNKFTQAATLGEEPFIKFNIYPTKIVVECNEDGFTKSNVDAICRVGASSKQNKRGYIGEKGIGFKSVFQVASKIHIQSNAFSFYFQYGGGDNENKLAIITPIWVNEEAPAPHEQLRTRMTLTLAQGTDYNDMISQIQDVPEDFLLFLSTLKRLEINLHQPNLRVISTKFCKSDGSDDGKIRLTKTIEDSNDGGTSSTIEKIYYITKKELSHLPRERVRQDIHDCEVVLAFPLDIAGGITRPLISDQHVFAFLPIRKFGFSIRVSSSAPLPHMIISILKQHKILFDHTFQRARRPERIGLLRNSHLDRFGHPLFEDLPESGWRSLSRSYKAEDVATLRNSFDLSYLDNISMFTGIRHDLLAPESKLRDLTMDDDWTTRPCTLIQSILGHSSVDAVRIRGLDLIPLINGEWVRPLEGTELHFPATIGPSIPGDLVTTVDPEFIRNQARKRLLGDHGAVHCRPVQVIEKLWNHYLRDGGAANLESSKMHLRYLYWHHHDPSSAHFGLLWLYDCNGGKVNSRRRVLYLRNDDCYGPYQLLKANENLTNARQNVPACPDLMTPAIVDALSSSEVACIGGKLRALKETFLPLRRLTNRAQALGINREFPFLELPHTTEDDQLPRCWNFLAEFGVGSSMCLSFYIEILRQLESKRQHSWSEADQGYILGPYEPINDYCSPHDVESLREEFDKNALILDPCSFESGATRPVWIDLEACVWNGPVHLLHLTPLASASQYRDNQKLAHFFSETLSIRDADWQNYLLMLLELQGGRLVPESTEALSLKVGRLYEHLASETVREEDWAAISQRMIWAINSRRPTDIDLESLRNTNCLPVRHLRSNGTLTTSFESCQEDFVVNDRRNLAEIFDNQVPFLDFTLEKILRLHPFLEALQLDQKYLSAICEQYTACDGTGIIDNRLTTEFRERAYEILRCAEFYGSSLNKHTLFERLQRTSILKSNDISTQHTLRLAGGIRTVHIPRGYVHVKDLQNSGEIFVPRLRRDRDMCYTTELPLALAKVLQISASAKGLLGNVLNGPLSILEEILDNEGIGQVQGIQQPTRPEFNDEMSDDQSYESRRNGAQSTATIIPQSSSVPENNPESSDEGSSEGDASPVDTEISISGSISRRQIENAAGHAPLHVSQDSSIFIGGSVSPEPSIPVSERQEALIRAVADPRNDYTNNSYRNLLDNVIRIATGIRTIPEFGAPISRGNPQTHDDFEHAATFGIRSQGQMNHDIKIGAAGELLVFEILSNLSLPLFSRENWASTIRHEVTVHEKYRDMAPWTSRETADITYDDDNGAFTSILVDKGYLEEYWRGSTPQYFIEIKTTTGDCNDRFFLSNSQYARMQRYTIPPGGTVPQVYIICRVFNLGKESLNVTIYVYPEAHRRSGDLVFEAQTWTNSG
ncbi:hypothetical protein DL98DRAFT_628772 [Cadophora sp. DSE1049]|nr:hypothetical protein DL98DRAFT_628772 [Cadophora sp. DSE1049]